MAEVFFHVFFLFLYLHQVLGTDVHITHYFLIIKKLNSYIHVLGLENKIEVEKTNWVYMYSLAALSFLAIRDGLDLDIEAI